MLFATVKGLYGRGGVDNDFIFDVMGVMEELVDYDSLKEANLRGLGL